MLRCLWLGCCALLALIGATRWHADASRDAATDHPPVIALQQLLVAADGELCLDPVTVPLLPERLTATVAEPNDVVACAAVIHSELARYPRSALTGTLRRLVLCGSLQSDGTRVAGTVDSRSGSLFVDVELGALHPPHLARVVHHELFHLIDAAAPDHDPADRDWRRLNGSGYRPALRAFEVLQGADEPCERFPGFISLYACTTAAEDKAETFEFLMMDPHYVERRAAGDAVVRHKVARLKHRLERYCGELDAGWFAQLAASALR